MAWSNSKAFARYVLDNQTRAINFDMDGDGYKIALYNNTTAPDNTVTTAVLSSYNGAASQWVVANEITGTNWAAGGVALASVTVAQSGANVTFDAADTSAATATIAGAFGGLVYDTTIGTQALCYLYFGGSQSVTAGTFTVVYSASGLIQFQA